MRKNKKNAIIRSVLTVVIVLSILWPGLCLGYAAPLDNKPLNIGDKAPPLSLGKWLKGEPVTEFKKGHIYLVEFGFTTCAPCLAGIPHLSELAAKYADDITVISVFVKDPISQVEKLMQRLGSKMKYKVAVDNEKGEMDTNWVKASGKVGYPKTFLIGRDGKIVWIGGLKGLDQALGQLVAKKPIEKNPSEQSPGLRVYLAKKKEDFETAFHIIDSLVQSNPNEPSHALLKFETLLETDTLQAYKYGCEMLKKYDWQLQGAGLYKTSLYLIVPNLSLEGYNLAIAMNEKVIETSPVELIVAHAYKTISIVHYILGDARKGEKVMMQAIETLPEGSLDYKKQLLEEIHIYNERVEKNGSIF